MGAPIKRQGRRVREHANRLVAAYGVQTFTDRGCPQEPRGGLSQRSIDAFHGCATFSGPTKVTVGDDALEGRYVVVAAGARPATVRIPGAEHLLTSEQFLELDRLPSRIVFVGGGYISFEFAHIAARAGATVSTHDGHAWRLS